MEGLTKVYILAGSLLGGGGGMVGGDVAIDILLEQGDKRWYTMASRNLDLQWAIEDEMAAIDTRIRNGTATDTDHIRRAVLVDRLKRLLVDEK